MQFAIRSAAPPLFSCHARAFAMRSQSLIHLVVTSFDGSENYCQTTKFSGTVTHKGAGQVRVQAPGVPNRYDVETRETCDYRKHYS